MWPIEISKISVTTWYQWHWPLLQVHLIFSIWFPNRLIKKDHLLDETDEDVDAKDDNDEDLKITKVRTIYIICIIN